MTDRDPALTEVLERLTPAQCAADDWEEVTRRAATPAEGLHPGRRAFAWGAIALAAAAAVALFATTPWSGGPNIVLRAEAALAIPPSTVLHLKIIDSYRNNLGTVTSTPTELWLSASGRYRGLTVDPDTGAHLEIGGTHSLRDSVQYDPSSNAIGPGLVTNMYYAFGDAVSTLRSQLAEGKATVDGTATVDGRTATRIRLRLIGADCKPVTDVLFVDPKSYRPIEYRVVVFLPNRVTLTRRFITYEPLPAHPSTVRLTDIRAMHPGAKVYPPPTSSGNGAPSCAGSPGP